jgi:hypothetical protein
MKRIVLAGVAGLALLTLAGCSKRQGIARSPDQFKADLGSAIESRMPALEACRKEIDPEAAKAKVAVEVSVQLDQTFGTKIDPKGQDNAKLGDCVKSALADIKLDPPDQNMGLGSWVITFNAPEDKKPITVK